MKGYTVVEVFYSLQGEGVRAGTANVFVRFAGCNLTCKVESHGFDCDTNFSGGITYTAPQLLHEMNRFLDPHAPTKACVLTGGEPLLQVDEALLEALKRDGWYIALETNGTKPLPGSSRPDWVCVSPKAAEHCMRIELADEVKYVLHHGMALPRPSITADHYLVSPAVQPEGSIKKPDLDWCMSLVLSHPQWRLSRQQHKTWGVR